MHDTWHMVERAVIAGRQSGWRPEKHSPGVESRDYSGPRRYMIITGSARFARSCDGVSVAS